MSTMFCEHLEGIQKLKDNEVTNCYSLDFRPTGSLRKAYVSSVATSHDLTTDSNT